MLLQTRPAIHCTLYHYRRLEEFSDNNILTVLIHQTFGHDQNLELIRGPAGTGTQTRGQARRGRGRGRGLLHSRHVPIPGRATPPRTCFQLNHVDWSTRLVTADKKRERTGGGGLPERTPEYRTGGRWRRQSGPKNGGDVERLGGTVFPGQMFRPSGSYRLPHLHQLVAWMGTGTVSRGRG